MSRAVLRSLLSALVLALTAVGVAVASPAEAHPFGDPQTVDLDLAEPDVVRVRWRIGMSDDLTYLAQFLGLLPEERVLLDGAVDYDDSDPSLLEGSDVFDDYLLQHVAVRSDGQDCTGVLVDKSDVLDDGATLEFTCAGDVTSAEVRVSTLTDLSPFYRTLATGSQGERAVYDGDHLEQRWSFDPTAGRSDLGRSAALQLGLVLGGLVVLGLLAVVLLRRRRTGSPADDEPAPTTGLVPAGRQD